MVALTDEVRRFLTDPASRRESDALLRRLPIEAPVLRLDGGGRRAWMISGHRLVTALANDPRCEMPKPQFPDRARAINPEFVDFFESSLSVGSPEDHRRLRGLLTREFAPAALARLRGEIQDAVDELLRPLAVTGELEFVADLAVPLPVATTGALLGLPPADRAAALDWASGLTANLAHSFPMGTAVPAAPMSRPAFIELDEHVRDLLHRQPVDGPQLIGRLAAATRSGQLTDDEAVRLVLLLFMTGFDTVTGGLTNALLTILRTPAAWSELVARPELAGRAFHEGIRLLTPTVMGPRVAVAPIPLDDGQLIRPGEMIFLGYAAANLDPEIGPDPYSFRLDRPGNRNVSFGHGTYFCVGAALADLQGRVVLETLARRYPGLRLADVDRPWREDVAFNGPAVLPLVDADHIGQRPRELAAVAR